MSAPFLTAEGLCFAYPDGPYVLRGLDLEVGRGEYAVLLGANGSGKSTLSRLANALFAPTGGTLHVFGLDTADPANRFAIRSRVGLVFQVPDNQIVATTVEDDVAFGPENLNLPPDEIARRVDEALRLTGLEAVRQRPPHLLSGGQKQALAVAGALAMRQEGLILDEATSMLDGEGRRHLLDLVRDLHQAGTSVLFVTHRMEEAVQADRVHLLADGRIALSGTPREVFQAGEALTRCHLVRPAAAELASRLHAGRPDLPAVALSADELLADLAAVLPAAAAPDGERPCVPPPAPSRAPDGGRPPLVRAEGLAHRYLKGTPLAADALLDGRLGLDSGEAVAVVGRTGSGKSTLIQHLNGILRSDAGRLEVAGVDLRAARPDVWAVRRQVGLLFQQPEDQLFEQLVGDDVAYGPLQLRLSLGEARERVRYALESVGLDFEAFKDRPVFSLSGGERRKVALAGVLALRPRLLVLDEPLVSLDPVAAAELLATLRRLKEKDGVALVVVSHHLDELLPLVDRLVVLAGGRTVDAVPTDDALADPCLFARHGLEMPLVARLVADLRARGALAPGPPARTVDAAAAAIVARLDTAGVGGCSRAAAERD